MSATHTSAIEVSGVCKRYGRTAAVNGVSFAIGRGEVVGLLGRNGAGKTTLMKMLAGYLKPDDGTVVLQGIDAVTAPVEAQRQLGYLPEHAPLYVEMTVQEYLGMIADLRGLAGAHRRACLRDAVLATGLEPRLMQPIGKLSKGFRQRVGIAQAIVHRPAVLILDEPTAGLDPAQIGDIRALIRDLARQTTILLSTHILGEVEANCQRVLVIDQGQLRADRALGELTAQRAVIVEAAAGQAPHQLADVLGALPGVARCTRLDEGEGDAAARGGYQRWRVTAHSGGDADADADLATAISAALARHGLAVRELRADHKGLDQIFAELARPEVNHDK